MMEKPFSSATGTAAVFGIALTLLSLSCSPQGASMRVGAPSAGFSGAEDGGSPKAAVRTAAVQSETVEDFITLSGDVAATGVVNVLPETSGLLTRVLVNPGDGVRAGQVIAWVDPSRPGMAYSESPVTARAAGTVTAVPAVAGNQVSPQTVVAQVGNLRDLEVDIRVPERHLGRLTPGMPARIRSRAFPDAVTSGRVTEIAPVVDSRSRTVAVTLTPDTADVLRPGQSVTVDLVLDSREDVTTVPESAVVERSGTTGVFVAAAGRAVWRPGVPGTAVSGRIEIIDSLNVGEQVVVSGADRISDGSPLNVLGS